eukprot:7103384-Prymnesium_polylepis.1
MDGLAHRVAGLTSSSPCSADTESASIARSTAATTIKFNVCRRFVAASRNERLHLESTRVGKGQAGVPGNTWALTRHDGQLWQSWQAQASHHRIVRGHTAHGHATEHALSSWSCCALDSTPDLRIRTCCA